MKNKKSLFLVVGVLIGFSWLSAQTWTPIKQVTWSTRGAETPAAAIDSSDNLHVVWIENLSPPVELQNQDSVVNIFANLEIYYKKSTNAGANWGVTKRLTWNAGQTNNVKIGVDSNDHIHIVWEDWTSGTAQIYHKKSTDGGSTWGALKRLTWTTWNCHKPVLLIDTNNYLHIVFYGNDEIYYKRSVDGGMTWIANKRLTWTTGANLDPVIAIDLYGFLYVVWTGNSPGNWEVYHKRSHDLGDTWGSSYRMTWNSEDESSPRIVGDGNNVVHLIYNKYLPGNLELYYRNTSNQGASWGNLKRLTWSSDWSFAQDFQLDSNHHLHLTWVELLSTNREIYYRKSTNSGLNWGASQRLTWHPARSDYPSIAIDSNDDIHIIWEDEKSGKKQLYHKRGY